MYDTSNIDESLLNNESLTMKDKQGSIYSIDGKKLYKASSYVEELNLLDGLEIICDKAFSIDPISRNKEVVLPESLKAIGSLAFFCNSSIEKINIPKSVEYISSENPFAGCKSLSEVSIYRNKYDIYDGFLYSVWEDELIAALPIKHEIMENEGVLNFKNWDRPPIRHLGKYAFWGVSCEKIELSSHMYFHEIPEFCFCYGNFREFTLPSDCKSIANHAFSHSKIEKIDLKYVSFIGDCAFWDCKNLMSCIFNNVITIENNAFNSCALEYVKLTKEIKSIGDYAFSNCPLRYVNIQGSPSYIGLDAFKSEKLDTIRCANKEMLDNDYIKSLKTKQNVLLISAGDPLPYIGDITLATTSLPISTSMSHRIRQFFDALGIKPIDGQIVRLRIPSVNKFLCGVQSDGNFVVLPRYDNVNAVISFDYLYSLTEIFYSRSTLYQLYLDSDLIFSDNSNHSYQLCAHNIRFKHLYKTSTYDYIDNNSKAEFIDSDRCPYEFDRLETTFPSKFVSLRKNGKCAVIVSGKFVTNFDFDSVYAIDNVFLNSKRIRVPLLSTNYIIVGNIVDGREMYGVIDINGNNTLSISYSRISACMNYILADNQLYKLEKPGIQLICTDIDLSVPIFVYKGIIAIFKSKDSYYAYRKGVLSKVDGDKYILYSSKDYLEYYNIKNGNLCVEDDTPDIDYDSGYSQDELNDMYRDAFDGNPDYESNID